MALQLIDAHFHVWDLDAQELPWLEGTDGSITHTYTLEELEVAYAATVSYTHLRAHETSV